MASYNETRTKDMQSRMEVAWESERNEQRRLLNEAHALVLDLQRSIRSRDEEFSREKKALLEQMRRLRKELDDEQLGRQAKLDKVVYLWYYCCWKILLILSLYILSLV